MNRAANGAISAALAHQHGRVNKWRFDGCARFGFINALVFAQFMKRFREALGQIGCSGIVDRGAIRVDLGRATDKNHIGETRL